MFCLLKKGAAFNPKIAAQTRMMIVALYYRGYFSCIGTDNLFKVDEGQDEKS